MKNYDVVAFDLDGTLSDPSAGLVEAYIYGFERMGIKDYGDKQSLRRYIGPPVYDEWKRDFKLTDDEAKKLLAYFREYYEIYGWWDNKLYPGIVDVLRELRAAGKKLILATSKPERTANRVVNFFDVAKYFDFIGASVDHVRDKKWQVLDYALNSVGCTDRSLAVMVGDRKYDKEGAELCGIDSLGVLYGHGSREEIDAAGFEYIAENVSDITRILLGK